MNIPQGSGTNPPAGHTTSNGMWGPSAAVGSIRFNTTLGAIEVWDGTQWMSVTAKSNPQTWRGWFDYYVCASNATSNAIADRYAQRDYIQQEMQGRFPGRYCVDLAGDTWTLVFDSPEDETWFHLKYE